MTYCNSLVALNTADDLRVPTSEGQCPLCWAVCRGLALLRDEEISICFYITTSDSTHWVWWTRDD